MKISRGEPQGFKPIVITLESEDDARHLRDLLLELSDQRRGTCYMLDQLLDAVAEEFE